MKTVLTSIAISLLFGCIGKEQKESSISPVVEEEPKLTLDSTWNHFSLMWKRDSLGEDGYRNQHCSFDSANNTWLINNANFVKYGRKSIDAILGTPNGMGYDYEGDSLFVMAYLIKKERTLLIYFDRNKKVEFIRQSLSRQ